MIGRQAVRYIILLFMGLPVCAGCAGIILPAFGYFPPVGHTAFSLQPFYDLAAYPGLLKSIWLSVFTGFGASLLSYIFAMVFLACLYGYSAQSWLFRIISPLLSVPHVTIAIGLYFLLQPSGWIIRLLSPELTGWMRPPNLNLVPDSHGLALLAGLVTKEMPFFVLMGLSALSQVRAHHLLSVSQSCGYGRFASWFLVIHPVLSAHLRLAIFIVLVFSFSVIDMALVIAPNTPPPLAVIILKLFQDPDLNMRLIGAAASVVLIACIGVAGICWIGCSTLTDYGIRQIIRRGWRLSLPDFSGLARWSSALRIFCISVIILPLIFCFLGLISSIIWAFAEVWRFPAALPQIWGMRGWAVNADLFMQAGWNSLILGFSASFFSLVLAIIWLETQQSRTEQLTATARAEKLVYLPLIVPQTAFLFGLQLLLITLNLDGQFIAILWAHCLFVFPYIMLSLSAQWRRFDSRYTDSAAVLGMGRAAQLIRVKIPMLGIPIGISFAIGFAVSAALYLPTIFAGHGRFITLTTEAVVLASGAGRQALGAATVMQMILPLIIFIAVEQLLRLRYRRFSAFRF